MAADYGALPHLRDLTTTDVTLIGSCNALTALRLRKPWLDPLHVLGCRGGKDYVAPWTISDVCEHAHHMPQLRLLSGVQVTCVHASCPAKIAAFISSFQRFERLELVNRYAAVHGRFSVSTCACLAM
jgi:hypothetical protein